MECTSRLRKLENEILCTNPFYQNQRIIVSSANADDLTTDLAYTAGVNGFLEKPLSIHNVYEGYTAILKKEMLTNKSSQHEKCVGFSNSSSSSNDVASMNNNNITKTTITNNGNDNDYNFSNATTLHNQHSQQEYSSTMAQYDGNTSVNDHDEDTDVGLSLY